MLDKYLILDDSINILVRNGEDRRKFIEKEKEQITIYKQIISESIKWCKLKDKTNIPPKRTYKFYLNKFKRLFRKKKRQP